MKRLQVFAARPKESINEYDALADYTWIEGFLKLQEIKKKIFSLTQDRERLKALPISKSCLRDRLKTGFEQAQKSRTRWFKVFIEGHLAAQDPFVDYNKHVSANKYFGQEPFLPFFTWPEIEGALSQISEKPGAVSMREKAARLLTVDREISSLKAKAAELSPERFLLRRDGKNPVDLREGLVQSWWILQNQMSEACGPFGRALKHSSKAEQGAWKRLLLSQALNPYGRLLPAPGKEQG